jgi:hypothetical protein
MQELGYKKLEDFYNISLEDLEKYGAKDIVEKLFDGSLTKTLQSLYPNHKWYSWKFEQKVYSGFWDQTENQKEFMDWLGKEMGINKKEEWLKLSKKDFEEKGGTGLLYKYGGSIYRLIQAVYPDKQKERQFVDWLGKELGFKQMDDWYKLTVKDIKENGGARLLHKYQQSPSKFVQSLFSDYKWLPWKFDSSQTEGFWNQQKNQKQFMNWLGNELGFKQMDDWYQITGKIIEENGGVGLLQKYNNSLIEVIESIYPNYKWLPWKFDQMIRGYWNQMENQTEFMNWLGKELGFKTLDDWYKVSHKDIQEKGGEGLLNKYGRSTFNLLSSIYPQHTWSKTIFSSKILW